MPKNSKDVPVLQEGASFLAYAESLENWALFVDLAPEKMVPYAIGIGLAEATIAQREAKTAMRDPATAKAWTSPAATTTTPGATPTDPPTVTTGPSPLAQFLTHMKRVLRADGFRPMMRLTKDFLTAKRESKETKQDFTERFKTVLQECHRAGCRTVTDAADSLLSSLFVSGLGLNAHEQTLLAAQVCVESDSFHDVVTAVENLFTNTDHKLNGVAMVAADANDDDDDANDGDDWDDGWSPDDDDHHYGMWNGPWYGHKGKKGKGYGKGGKSQHHGKSNYGGGNNWSQNFGNGWHHKGKGKGKGHQGGKNGGKYQSGNGYYNGGHGFGPFGSKNPKGKGNKSYSGGFRKGQYPYGSGWNYGYSYFCDGDADWEDPDGDWNFGFENGEVEPIEEAQEEAYSS